ncbi:MAG: AI-2E family transporter [Burkholderiaceae bacterium]
MNTPLHQHPALPKAPAMSDAAAPQPAANAPALESPTEPAEPASEFDANGLALTILAALAVLFALQWAQAFLIPLVFGVLIAYTLNPPIVWLERLHVPRLIGVVLVMAIMLGSAGAAVNSLRTEFQSIVEQLPVATQKLSKAVAKMRGGKHDTLERMQAAASEIERAASQAAGTLRRPSPASSPAPAAPPFQLSSWLWASSIGAMAFMGQATVVIFLVFFILASGDIFKRKLVKLAGPSLSSKRITVSILNDINTSVQKYMFMLLVTNGLLTLLMWAALRAVGLENAGAWALAAGLLHVVPYFGPLLIAGALGLAAFMQFGTFGMMLLVIGISLAAATLIGTFVTTWMTGRIAKMNAAAVFIGLLFWGWLWGISGLLLGIPIIVIVKVVSEHVDGMLPLAEMLGQ